MLSVNKNQIMIDQYDEIMNVTSTFIQVKMQYYTVSIKGEQLHVLALGKNEILLEGTIDCVGFAYE